MRAPHSAHGSSFEAQRAALSAPGRGRSRRTGPAAGRPRRGARPRRGRPASRVPSGCSMGRRADADADEAPAVTTARPDPGRRAGRRERQHQGALRGLAERDRRHRRDRRPGRREPGLRDPGRPYAGRAGRHPAHRADRARAGRPRRPPADRVHGRPRREPVDRRGGRRLTAPPVPDQHRRRCRGDRGAPGRLPRRRPHGGDDAPGASRPPGRARRAHGTRQPAPVRDRDDAAPRGLPGHRRHRRAPAARPRPLQGGQRHPRPRRG